MSRPYSKNWKERMMKCCGGWAQSHGEGDQEHWEWHYISGGVERAIGNWLSINSCFEENNKMNPGASEFPVGVLRLLIDELDLLKEIVSLNESSLKATKALGEMDDSLGFIERRMTSSEYNIDCARYDIGTVLEMIEYCKELQQKGDEDEL